MMPCMYSCIAGCVGRRHHDVRTDYGTMGVATGVGVARGADVNPSPN